MTENPFMLLLYAGAAVYIGQIYWRDIRAVQRGEPDPQAMPGAQPASVRVLLMATLGALLLLGVETGGEIALGLSAEQSDIAALFLVAMIAAGLVEEVVFRGFLVVTGKGKAALVGSCVGFSLLFALLHPYLWSYEDGTLEFHFTLKAVFTTSILFVRSLWFYYARFASWNPNQSLLPCMVAHSLSNIGVFLIKLAQGHVNF